MDYDVAGNQLHRKMKFTNLGSLAVLDVPLPVEEPIRNLKNTLIFYGLLEILEYNLTCIIIRTVNCHPGFF